MDFPGKKVSWKETVINQGECEGSRARLQALEESET